MPTVVLQGGLGNQLFQYAVGRSLAHETDSELYLETSAFARPPSSGLPARKFYLSNVAIQGKIVRRPIDASFFRKGQFKLLNLLRGISPELAARVCRVHRDLDRPRCFAPHVLRLPGNALLYGYYQSEKYFYSIREMLRKELSVRSEPEGMNREWKAQIDREKSVGVHVRRGDYVGQGWSLPPRYYRKAIRTIARKNEKLRLFFFSDQIRWVRENIKSVLPERFPPKMVSYVDCNGSHKAHEDLRLMKSCSHNIISNSTFSWWGAWLNGNREKTVLAPGFWLRNRVEGLDIIPDRWEIVDW